MSADGFRAWKDVASNVNPSIIIPVTFQINWSAEPNNQALLTFLVEGATEAYTVLNSGGEYSINFGDPTEVAITGKVRFESSDGTATLRYEVKFVYSEAPLDPYTEIGTLADWMVAPQMQGVALAGGASNR